MASGSRTVICVKLLNFEFSPFGSDIFRIMILNFLSLWHRDAMQSDSGTFLVYLHFLAVCAFSIVPLLALNYSNQLNAYNSVKYRTREEEIIEISQTEKTIEDHTTAESLLDLLAITNSTETDQTDFSTETITTTTLRKHPRSYSIFRLRGTKFNRNTG